jgi:hypothetical protein
MFIASCDKHGGDGREYWGKCETDTWFLQHFNGVLPSRKAKLDMAHLKTHRKLEKKKAKPQCKIYS